MKEWVVKSTKRHGLVADMSHNYNILMICSYLFWQKMGSVQGLGYVTLGLGWIWLGLYSIRFRYGSFSLFLNSTTLCSKWSAWWKTDRVPIEWKDVKLSWQRLWPHLLVHRNMINISFMCDILDQSEILKNRLLFC